MHCSRLAATRAAALLFVALGACRSGGAPPTPPESGRVRSFDGLELAYDAAGDGATALVLVHGWCCNRSHWAHTLRALATDHRVVALDLGGHGESGAERAEWRLEDLARDVEALVDALKLDRVVLVGHSMGGPVSLFAAARMPERVVGVVGVETLHDPDFQYTAEGLEPFLSALREDREAFFAESVGSTFLPGADPELVQRVTDDALATPEDVAAGLLEAFVGFDPARALRDCPAPVRVINAPDVRETRAEALRAIDPSFEVREMHGVGHFPMLERPAELEALLRETLASLPPPSR